MTRTDPHDPTDACTSVHCHAHGVDENPHHPYRVCFECGHAFPTRCALWRDHMQRIVEIFRADFRRYPWEAVRMVAYHATRPASLIRICPHCTHDL